jgi:hypothetical protein
LSVFQSQRSNTELFFVFFFSSLAHPISDLFQPPHSILSDLLALDMKLSVSFAFFMTLWVVRPANARKIIKARVEAASVAAQYDWSGPPFDWPGLLSGGPGDTQICSSDNCNIGERSNDPDVTVDTSSVTQAEIEVDAVEAVGAPEPVSTAPVW